MLILLKLILVSRNRFVPTSFILVKAPLLLWHKAVPYCVESGIYYKIWGFRNTGLNILMNIYIYLHIDVGVCVRERQRQRENNRRPA